MRRIPRIVLLLLCALSSRAFAVEPEGFDDALSFENSGHALSVFWGGGPAESLGLDRAVRHGGAAAARLVRDAQTSQAFSVLTGRIDVDFAGQTLELRGFLRSEAIDGWFGLWMRQDGTSGPVGFDNMQSRQLSGTTEWTEYSIELPLSGEAKQVFFGALMTGNGTLWADDLSIWVDGEPLRDVRRVEVKRTALDLDTEFDEGSGLALQDLDAADFDRLATLGRLWGYLKYHHPRVTGGELHWDYELFRAIPRVLDARDATAALVSWVDGLGPVPECARCIGAATGQAHLEAPTEEIFASFDPPLRAKLEAIHAKRPAGRQSFYLSTASGPGNPEFRNEPAYPGRFDPGYRLLALFRFWNAVEWAFPYRDLVEGDWAATLREFVPRALEAGTEETYARVLLQLVARVNDGHCNLWSGLVHRPPAGTCDLPVAAREVEGAWFIDGTHPPTGLVTPLETGDRILAVDGRPVEEIYRDVHPFYAASNEPRRRLDFARSLGRGPCEDALLRIERAGHERELRVPRIPLKDLDTTGVLWHDRPGDFLQDLGEGVLYAKLSKVDEPGRKELVRRAENARGLVIDIRNYPAAFVVFTLGQHLVEETTPFVRFTKVDLEHPGRFEFGPPLSLSPGEPYLDLPVTVLLDECSMSQAEYTALAFSVGPRVTLVGSTTAGADGNVSPIPLPGGHRTMVSGIGVFHADRSPTQRVGIVPDVEAEPSIAGLRAGRDEVLEEGLRVILGDDFDPDRIVEMARRPDWPRP